MQVFGYGVKYVATDSGTHLAVRHQALPPETVFDTNGGAGIEKPCA